MPSPAVSSESVPVPDSVTVIGIPLEDGRHGACWIARETKNPRGSFCVMVVTEYMADQPPGLTDERVKTPLPISSSWARKSDLEWWALSGVRPDRFPQIGKLKIPKKTMLKIMKAIPAGLMGNWDSVPAAVFHSWERWHDPEAVKAKAEAIERKRKDERAAYLVALEQEHPIPPLGAPAHLEHLTRPEVESQLAVFVRDYLAALGRLNNDYMAMPESERSNRELSFRWRASQWRTRIFIPFHEGVFTGCSKGAWGGTDWLNEDPVHCRIAKIVKKPSHWEVEVHNFKEKTPEPAWQFDIRHRPDGTFRIVAKRGPNVRAGRGWFDLAL